MKERVQRIFRHLSPTPEAIVLVNSVEPHLDQSFFYVFDSASGLFEGSAAIALPDGSLHVSTSLLEEESALQAAKHDPHLDIHLVKTADDRKKWLQKMLPAKGHVGLNFHELTHEDFLSVSGAVPGVGWVDASTAVRRARRVKDAAEVERIREAGRIGSVVAGEIPSLLKRGITESGLASEIEYRMMKAGASGRSFQTIVGFGAHGAEPHYSPAATPL
ncbi:MAG: M24 family metallopeptidase, partial [Thermoplasmata archaeon]|nr:M24 family metallopeptidase [Thermoplasmata archaeon]